MAALKLTIVMSTLGTVEGPGEIEQGPYQPLAWHHGTVTFDGTTKRIYLYGMPGPSFMPGAIIYDDAALRIGCDTDMNVINSPLQGRIDELRFYARALSPSEIMDLALNP